MTANIIKKNIIYKKNRYNFSWTVGQLDNWTVGQLGSWAVGQLDSWTVGQLGSWAVGQLDNWTVGQLGSWIRLNTDIYLLPYQLINN
jgi:hypothetical protein